MKFAPTKKFHGISWSKRPPTSPKLSNLEIFIKIMKIKFETTKRNENRLMKTNINIPKSQNMNQISKFSKIHIYTCVTAQKRQNRSTGPRETETHKKNQIYHQIQREKSCRKPVFIILGRTFSIVKIRNNNNPPPYSAQPP